MRTKLMPTRKDKEPVEVFANLDKLISEPLRFELHGKVRTLKPVTTEDFYKFTNASVNFTEMMQKDDSTPDEVIEAFTNVFKSLCDDITKEDVKKMTKVQVGALYRLVVDHAHGVSHGMDQEDLKKKTLAMFN